MASPFSPPIQTPGPPQPINQSVPDAGPWNGGTSTLPTVGNFGTVAATNANGGVGGAQPGNAYLPPKGSKTAPPLLSGMQDYGDYQNFGAIAQQYGAQGAQQLNTPGVTNALGMNQLGAEGQLRGQAQQNSATGVLGQAAGGHSQSLGLLGQAAAGNTPSAAQMQQTAGIQQGLSQAQSQAASTRGNFGLANAQKQAMAAQATGASAAAQQGGALRAQEMAQAQQAYAGAQGQAQGQYAQAAGAQANNQLLGAQQNFGAQSQNQGTNLGYLMGQQQAYQNQAGTALGAAEGQGNLDIGQGAQNTQQAIANQANTTAEVGAGASATGALITGAALLSDERTKRDIRPAGDVLSQLDHFKPYGFGYKSDRDTPNQQASSAPQVGVMAQDVEQGPAGRMLVQQTSDGRKALHIPSMVGVMAAGEGALKQRGDEHEARLARLEKLLRAA